MAVIYEVELRVVLRDLGLLTVIPVILISSHFYFPADIRSELAFQYPNFEVITLLTSAYVHGTTIHLIHNIVGYTCAAIVGYLLTLNIGKRTWYWLTFPILVFVLPVFTTLGDYLFFSVFYPNQTAFVRGFSGIVASLTGFIAVVFLRFVHQNYGMLATRYMGQFLILTILAELFLLYTDPIPLMGIGSVCLGIVLIGVEIALEKPSFATKNLRLKHWLHGIVTAVVFLFLVVFTYQLLRPQRTGNVHTHVIGHGLGFIGGAVCAGFCLLVQFKWGDISEN